MVMMIRPRAYAYFRDGKLAKDVREGLPTLMKFAELWQRHRKKHINNRFPRTVIVQIGEGNPISSERMHFE